MNNDSGTAFLKQEWFQQFAERATKSRWNPIPRLDWTVGFFVAITLIALPLGGAMFYASKQNIRFTFRYDNFEGAENNADRRDLIWNVEPYVTQVTVSNERSMDAPVYVYYELTDFYQNHKRYVRSQNAQQLGGEDPNPSSMSACDPYRYAPRQEGTSPDEERQVIVPCGLVAHSLFNDSFKLDRGFDAEARDLNLIMEERKIATEWDRKYLYGDIEPEFFNNIPSLSGGGQIRGHITSLMAITGYSVGNLDQDEHFMVWMRVGSRPTVRKLYGIIHKDIPKGSRLIFNITHRYNTYDFNGQKKLILTTSNWTGGRNEFTGVVYFVIGSASAVACIFILLLDLRSNRQPGDLRALSWNKQR